MYFLLDRNNKPGRWINKKPYVGGVSWWSGAKILNNLPEPLEFTLKAYKPHSADHAQYMPAILYSNPPLFRDDFICAILEFGVNNIDVYNVAISDPDDGAVYSNYKAVNIIGLIPAADMVLSAATVHDGIPLIDVDFDGLVIDERKALGMMIFRLAESTKAIIIHQNLRDYLLEKGFGDDVEFYDTKDVAL